MQSVLIPKASQGRDKAVERLATVLRALDPEKSFEVTTKEKKPKRSESQNRLMWSIYTQILERGGEEMGGWTKDDLHEFFLINHFGSETKSMFGRKRLVPLRRSSRLNKQEFSDFVDGIARFMAERGVFIDLPGDL